MPSMAVINRHGVDKKLFPEKMEVPFWAKVDQVRRRPTMKHNLKFVLNTFTINDLSAIQSNESWLVKKGGCGCHGVYGDGR